MTFAHVLLSIALQSSTEAEAITPQEPWETSSGSMYSHKSAKKCLKAISDWAARERENGPGSASIAPSNWSLVPSSGWTGKGKGWLKTAELVETDGTLQSTLKIVTWKWCEGRDEHEMRDISFKEKRLTT